ncbi:MAG: DUF3696 domain-containing protein [Magnetococcales bacterium]|nr:DUF3696 domain-containing protein [Magnetococcales bacterium]
MITEIKLKHYKCFEHLILHCSGLTLLSGANSSGKSSVLQSLVILHQTMKEHEWSSRLMLNGAAICLGTVADVIDQVNGRKSFEISLTDSDRKYHWFFSGDRGEMSLSIDRIEIGNQAVPTKELHHLLPREDNTFKEFSQRMTNLTYITAERNGPRDFYPLKDEHSVTVIGTRGEDIASLLYWKGNNPVLEELAIGDEPTTLSHQVRARMKTFFPGFELDIIRIPGVNHVSLGLRTSTDTPYHKPVHEGFGLSQVFPIVVAALLATKDDLLLIENPEVHLHPSGQGRMGQFLADVAGAGVQVFVETHSDHILNGIRRAVRGKRLRPEQVSLYFFNPRTESSPQVINPLLDQFGNIDSWPERFFDQFDKDANHFAGWGE